VINETDTFRRAVIDDFIDEHRAGRTPNPCVRCNERLKFAPLVRFAQAIGADALATGHYARLVPGAEEHGALPRLLRALDRDKDQSYFLFGVRPEVFDRVIFPLGDKTKDEVRAIARRAGLPNADKPDSQQICFIPDGDHRAYVEAHGGAGAPGAIVDEAGAELARVPASALTSDAIVHERVAAPPVRRRAAPAPGAPSSASACWWRCPEGWTPPWPPPSWSKPVTR
jgi:tRNA-specific 2-thiouridylase